MLNREPMGMKRYPTAAAWIAGTSFSAQPRADGDEADAAGDQFDTTILFQCSTASRWG